MTAMATELAGEQVLLLPQKALYWPAARTLMVADIHFGKAASFRAQGVPVPRGTTSENLAALETLLTTHDAQRIIFLGDFLHAKAAQAPATLQAMLDWRSRHRELELLLVRGNHDWHAGDPSELLHVALADEPFACGPFALCHHPGVACEGYAIAGHVHPVFHLRTARESLRLPCFLLGTSRAILPAFGAFTGGHSLIPQASDKVYVVAEDSVFLIEKR
ncbi:ligase-associated DNA damage response endonuclease PdeM [Duganella sp. Root1480D1]|uniref:ligase-associated DNA damage response endonuclease PdeM n=1 Tax=Duganella sp. Root1480D1 TaxID=1736471 RepID=UPI000709B337|nr:ligase-associated DNA damage response endonuclease PdeM [Duganella sp. Root1480D1]KQZ41409.1 DEAD/DEAH box helicase [Duganella sp. Root1480D1]